MQCVFYSMFAGKERWMAEQVAQMLNEKCKVLETLSKCQQEVGIITSWQTGSLATDKKCLRLTTEAKCVGSSLQHHYKCHHQKYAIMNIYLNFLDCLI